MSYRWSRRTSKRWVTTTKSIIRKIGVKKTSLIIRKVADTIIHNDKGFKSGDDFSVGSCTTEEVVNELQSALSEAIDYE